MPVPPTTTDSSAIVGSTWIPAARAGPVRSNTIATKETTAAVAHAIAPASSPGEESLKDEAYGSATTMPSNGRTNRPVGPGTIAWKRTARCRTIV